MKPAYERNQECLPPKKRELAVNSGGGGTAEGLVAGSAGKGLCVGVAEEAPSTHSSDSAGCEAQGGGATRDWMRVQPGLHYGVENTDGMGVPVDQYGMLYKVAATYSPTSLHPVLSHISPAYTVPSQILQHPGISYSPLAYAQIPHSSFQFVGSPYAVPYALPPGFVPGHLMSPQSTIQQPHHVPHLVGYPSVIQEEDEQEEPMEVQNQPPRSDRAPADQVKSQSGYYLHTEGQPLRPGAGGASQRRWSSPSFQRYGVKGGEEARPSASPTAVPRPSFIPQEVKLSIEGRSNAGK